MPRKVEKGIVIFSDNQTKVILRRRPSLHTDNWHASICHLGVCIRRSTQTDDFELAKRCAMSFLKVVLKGFKKNNDPKRLNIFKKKSGLEIYYTYVFYDPTRNHEPFYVGKGKDERVYERKNAAVERRINAITKLGKQVGIGIYGGLTEELALLTEEFFIWKYGRKDLKTVTLMNFTSGGEGSSPGIRTRIRMSKPKSPEHKKKLAAALAIARASKKK